MLLIQSEEFLSEHLLNLLIRMLETLYDVFLGWIDIRIIGDNIYDHFRHNYTRLESENQQMKK